MTRSGALLYSTGENTWDLWLGTIDLASARVLDKKRIEAPSGAVVSGMGSFSPDGSLMAYLVRVGRSKTGLVFAASDGSKPRLVLPAVGPNSDPHPNWSADARTLFVGGYPEPGLKAFARVDVQSGASEPLFEPFKIEHRAPGDQVSYLAGVSPDGKTAYYEKLDGAKRSASLWKRDVASGNEQELFRSAGPAGLIPLCLSPGGTRLAFNLISFPTPTTRRSQLMTLSLTDGSTQTICELPETLIMRSAAWSPEGRYIVYAQDRETDTELHIVDANGGQPKSLGVTADQIRGVALHPDGKRIAYVTLKSAKTEWWLLENFLPPVKPVAPAKK
jgi:Tol biopolymer transport system component